MKTKKIYLVRHGEISGNGEKRYIGQIDLPLNDNGRKQAERLRDELANVQVSMIFCSDLLRSLSTAGIICEKHMLEPVVKRQLREINMGLWDGLSFEEVRRSYPGEFEKRGADVVNYKPPGGESFAQCAGRVMAALDDILNTARGNIIIVGHAGINRILISQALGLPLENMFRIKQDYGCLNILLTSEQGWQVHTINYFSDLKHL